jgi:hypothetical protein
VEGIRREIMKKEVRESEIRKQYGKRIICVGYCHLQFLLKGTDPFAYSTRMEGWACDYYEIPRGICISTGYSPIGKHVDYDFLRKYDEAAREILSQYHIWDEQKAKLDALLEDFAGDIESMYLNKKMLPGQLYEPEEGKYDLPIFEQDNAISAYTWKYFMDTYVANYGHKANPKQFRKHIKEILKMVSEDVMETFDLCEEKIMEYVEEVD